MQLRTPGIAMAVLVTTTSLTGCFGPSKADIAEAKKACSSFYQRERAEHNAIVHPIDNWTKDGVIVIELAEKATAGATTYTAHICVYDKEKGTISLPGAFHQSRWLK
ncbi:MULTISPECIES: hypothetical protein [unclassified Acidovorax]|uniref:hypothetical protein n=1 Tax=unclassified Acidovorax TaxID=2684926 RepID=UPI000BC53AF5|nr:MULTISPECIES: hypothetical protein [unclassified Acidovorax]OZA56982.1 MAG: hypothetical protein B7X79_08595 [Acidovorax sp. 17-64-282]HQS21964.1 hypothetical protein [Acidovorax defluvii]OYY27552.1 MAG: hypothetical protein B7Y64_11450 [Acidovorax sp. 35-64-16]OYY82717.1 MAG: hypothetical protein B7Y46_17635 [Acidovorax sp. 28-64-14]OYZ44069.1 MAG: hypothetical protein B7Y20_12715 [Acidovorax sp. 16-64-162]